jgi:hypothetical protein
MSTLDADTLDLLDRSGEVDLRTPRRDGSESSRPVWIVVVDGEPYVRSYRGESGAWYRRARTDGRLAIAVGARVVDFAAAPEGDPALNERISAAFQEKYGEQSPGPTAEMIAPGVVETTLRLTPAG